MLNGLLLLALLGSDDLNMIGRNSDLNMSGNIKATVKAKRQLNFYGPSWCPHCPTAKEQVKQLASEFDIRYYDNNEEYPESVIQQAAKKDWGYPLIHWRLTDGTGKYMVWQNMEAFRNADIPVGQAPTPQQEIDRILAFVPKPEVAFVDFGCGDARWCIAAAKKWQCKAVGIEIDPDRAAFARGRVSNAKLDHLITIIEGDATKIDVKADVGVAYLYTDTLQQLKPRLEKLRYFVSYLHQPTGLPVVRNGDCWLYAPNTIRSGLAVWGGQGYSQPVCDDSNCVMCNSIRQQLSKMR